MFVVMAVVLIIRPYGLLGREEVAGEHGQVGAPETPIRPYGMTGQLLVVALLALLAALPLFADRFLLILMIDMVVFALFAASLHFILGSGGLVSFGHAAFFGGGAYAAALLVFHTDTPMELAFLFAPLAAGLVLHPPDGGLFRDAHPRLLAARLVARLPVARGDAGR
jgi:branched-chain amino acid transport system permease protein